MALDSAHGTLEKAPHREAVPRRYTYAQLRAELPETNQPSELWEGTLVMSPAPSFYHQEVALRFYRHLQDWVSNHGLGKAIAAPVDMVLSEHQTTQPDVAFIARDRLSIIQEAIAGPADLVAEVLSLGSRTRDRIEKRDLYEQHGVKEYWIIDPESQTVDVMFSERGVFQLAMRCGIGQTAQSRLLAGFQIAVQELFHGAEGKG
jgi:Uma2 family endonuclease